jgi:hypothetical protein
MLKNNVAVMADPLFEHRYWLRILRDHLTFILEKLSGEEDKEHIIAHELKQRVVEQLITLDKTINNETLINLVKEIRVFKVHLLRRLTAKGDNFRLSLPATFIAGTLVELDQYLHIINSIVECKTHNEPILIIHDLYLLDAAGHAQYIADNLDPIEKDLKKQFKKMVGKFKGLHCKAKELINYVLYLGNSVEAIERLNASSVDEVNVFVIMLVELYNMLINKEVIAGFSPLFIDHMLREEAYYLMKLGINVGNRPLEDLVE